MPKKQRPSSAPKDRSAAKDRSFHLEFKNPTQKMAWTDFQQHDILFLLGPAGTGKSFLAMAFAINEVLAKRKKRIILTRPIVEAGESLGYLPGTFDEKVAPYIMPLFDCMTKLVGPNTSGLREIINSCIEVAPLAYLRGRTFEDSVCIFDEAQNATYAQLKLYLSRIGENSKMIINGDPDQSDIPGPVALSNIIDRLEDDPGIGIVEFDNSEIVRNPIIARILEKL
jgi:phosphate starvation-inducible PhoH-like protein